METTETVDPNQRNALLAKIDTLILNPLFDQHEIASLVEDFGDFYPDLRALLSKYAVNYKKCFGKPIASFTIVITDNFKHELCIDKYVTETAKKKWVFYNPTFNSKNFERATYKMLPGDKYRVKIYPIMTSVTSRTCLKFLQKEGAVLTSCQGLVEALRSAEEHFPVGKTVVSFDLKEDEKKNRFLCIINDGSWVAQATRAETQLILGLHYYEAALEPDTCLLAFFKNEPKKKD